MILNANPSSFNECVGNLHRHIFQETNLLLLPADPDWHRLLTEVSLSACCTQANPNQTPVFQQIWLTAVLLSCPVNQSLF